MAIATGATLQTAVIEALNPAKQHVVIQCKEVNVSPKTHTVCFLRTTKGIFCSRFVKDKEGRCHAKIPKSYIRRLRVGRKVAFKPRKKRASTVVLDCDQALSSILILKTIE